MNPKSFFVNHIMLDSKHKQKKTPDVLNNGCLFISNLYSFANSNKNNLCPFAHFHEISRTYDAINTVKNVVFAHHMEIFEHIN